MIKLFRKYEKYIFWGIVFVILPAFPISGIMLSTCGQSGPRPVGELYGKTVYGDRFEQERSRLARFRQVFGGGDMRDEMIWDHLAFLEQADRAGIEVSDDELSTEAQRIYRDSVAQRKAIERIRAEFGEVRDQNMLERIFQYVKNEEFPKTVFDFEGYTLLLKNAQIAPAEFERTLRELLRIQKLHELVRAGAKPDVEKLYEAYQDQNHKRKAVYVAFRGEDFPLGATASADELRKHYDKAPDRYREPARVSIEWLSVPIDAFEKDVPAPSEQELLARYEAVKARYKIDAPAPATGAAQVETFRPLAEVSAEIARELRADKKLDLASKKAEELRQVAATSTAVALSTLAQGAGARHGASGLVEELDLIKFPEIRFWNLLNSVARLTTANAALQVSEVARHEEKTSAFFVRLVERRLTRVPPFEECKARVEESYLRGLDDDLRKYHSDNMAKYKTPATASLEWVYVPFARFENQVGPSVTGTARADELRKKALARLEEVRTGASEKTQEGKLRDMETVALDKGAEHGRASVETSGKDIPAQIKSTEVLARLSGSLDKIGELSSSIENDDKTGVFLYTVRATKAEQQLLLADVKERVRKDLLDERAYDRARDAADAFVKEVGARPEELRSLAAKRGLAVRDTGFLTRKDGQSVKLDGAVDAQRIVSSLFGLPETGAVSSPAHDMTNKATYVVRFAAKEPADPKGFADAEKELRASYQVMRATAEEADALWSNQVLLQARSVDEDILKEVYALKMGAEGLARVEASQIYIEADAAVVKEELGKKAKLAAQEALAEVRKGARFDDVARKRSQDSFRRRGGETPFFTRGALPRELKDVGEVEAIAFSQKPGETSEPFETRLGWHVLQTTERRGDEVRIKHMLFRSERVPDEDGNIPPLDAAIEKLALDKAREKAEKALARIQAGEDFAAVANDASDQPYLAQRTTYEYETAFERAAYAETLGEPSQVVAGEGDKWQLLLVDDGSSRAERDRDERLPSELRPRMVRRIELSGDKGKRRLEKLREELIDFRTRLEQESQAARADGRGRSSWEFREKFEELAKSESDAASGARGGRVGVFRPDPRISRFGTAFRDALYAMKDGETSGLVKGKNGWHVIRMHGRTKQTFEQARPEVADALLDGLTF